MGNDLERTAQNPGLLSPRFQFLPAHASRCQAVEAGAVKSSGGWGSLNTISTGSSAGLPGW